METKLFLIVCALLCSLTPPVQAQKILRFQIWTQAEPLPNSEAQYDHPADYARENLHKTSAFLLTGLIYGWNFYYTPSDAARGVPEYFHFEPVHEIEKNDTRMVFDQPFFLENKLYAWVSYACTPAQENLLQRWNTVVAPKAGGSGSGPIFAEFEGIHETLETALKDAIRQYSRKITKNKPKEINGRALLCEPPSFRIENGRYMTNASFYLNITEILPYSVF